MYNPPHPGEIVREDCLKALDLSVTEAAKGLGVTRKTLSSILNGRSGITAEMARGCPKRLEARRSTG
jgi:addiction module HigA family antidote